jgi:hypothetical protein
LVWLLALPCCFPPEFSHIVAPRLSSHPIALPILQIPFNWKFNGQNGGGEENGREEAIRGRGGEMPMKTLGGR